MFLSADEQVPSRWVARPLVAASAYGDVSIGGCVPV